MALTAADVYVDGQKVSKAQARAWGKSVEDALGDTSFKRSFFSTLAAATAATIPSTTDIVVTLGRVAAGDNGGATYTRISSSSAAAWRFQSADGQWWTLADKVVTPEMFGAFSGGADCTAALAAFASWINTVVLAGVTLRFKPGAAYSIWPEASGTPGAALLDFASVSGLRFEYNGAKLTTDNDFSPTTNPAVYRFYGCRQITFDDPWYVQTAYTGFTLGRGGTHIFAIDDSSTYNSGFVINNVRQTGGVGCVMVGASTWAYNMSRDFVINNVDIDSVYYGLSFSGSGDNVVANNIRCTNVVRAYFPWNVSNHKVQVMLDGGDPHDQCLLKCYALPSAPNERNVLSNIDLTVRSRGDVAGNARSIVGLAMQQSVAAPTISAIADNGSGKVRLTVNSTTGVATSQIFYFAGFTGGAAANINAKKLIVTVIDATHLDLTQVTYVGGGTAGTMSLVAAIRNIKVTFDINQNAATFAQPPAILTYKQDSADAADTTTRGYEIDNVVFSGTLQHYDNSIPVLDLFNNTGGSYSLGAWTGETIRNIIFRDLHIEGVAGTASINATDIQSGLVFDNVYAPSTITWTLTKGERLRRVGSVDVAGLPSDVTVSAASYTVLGYEDDLHYNTAATNTTTLPAAANSKGKILRLHTWTAFAVNSASSNVVQPTTGSLGTAILAATAGKWAILKSDGNFWTIIAQN